VGGVKQSRNLQRKPREKAGGRYAADLFLATAGSRVRFRCDYLH
jgi:hypothetical protein